MWRLRCTQEDVCQTVSRMVRVRNVTLGGGGGGHGGTADLLTNFFVKVDVAEAKGLPLSDWILSFFLSSRGSSQSSNSKFGFHSSVVARKDKDVITTMRDPNPDLLSAPLICNSCFSI